MAEVRLWSLAALVLAVVSVGSAADRVYVGVEVCAQCHEDGAARRQVSTWMRSAHSRAYAALARPESLEIARLSGIDVNPFDSPICMGCHATASDAEAWERDPTFHLADGVQCEFCHGPGSEYIDPEVMADSERARAAGLRTSDRADCMVCHKPKGSHVAVLEVRAFEHEMALAEIGHGGRGGELPSAPERAEGTARGFVGVMACASCHDGPRGGYVASKWRLTAHAEAWAVLGSDAARSIADAAGVGGDPQRAAACLGCHTTASGEPMSRIHEGFDPRRGVQCESCHGAGSDYLPEAVMRDPVGARRAGLSAVTRETCEACHQDGIHGRVFDFEKALAAVDHSRRDLTTEADEQRAYKTPFNLAVSPDGRRLYVACEASDSLMIVDTVGLRVVAEIEVEQLPHGVCLSPDGRRVYVSNRGSDTVSVVDVDRLAVVASIVVGDEPHGLVTDRSGGVLFVANAGSYDISVVDLEQRREVKRLSAGRGTWDVARSHDGDNVYVTNNLSHYVRFREPSRSEVTVVGAARAVVEDRVMISEANLVQGVDVAPGGEFALVTLIRTKNLVPMTRVIQGWVLTNGIGILWPDGRVDQLLLDEPDRYFADPTDVAITPDGRWAYVTGGGVDEVAVIDLERMRSIIESATPEERSTLLPNHLGVPTEMVATRIPVGTNPRGVTVSPDGRFVYVADALDDAVSVIDTTSQRRTAVIDLGGPAELTTARHGERIFHSAAITYGQQFSCHSCHPDGGIDAITYDIEPDGIGVNPVDNRTLRGILDTAPFKWTGKNPSLSRQCGPRLAVFFTRIDPFTPEQVRDLESYIRTIPRNPNRYRALGAQLTPAQRRGKEVFDRVATNSGDAIPRENRCNFCHRQPYFTNREKFYVGPGSHLDTHTVFDVPHLNNIYETSPYLHDGRADTLEEIWTRYNPYDDHGVTNDMTKDQLNDLVEYLKTL